CVGAAGCVDGAPPGLRHRRPVEWLRTVPWDSVGDVWRGAFEDVVLVAPVHRETASDFATALESQRGWSRRGFLVAGATAAAAAAAAAVWRPWESSSHGAAR